MPLVSNCILKVVSSYPLWIPLHHELRTKCEFFNMENCLQLYVHGEKFNQPIFHCNNISGYVEPVSYHRSFYDKTDAYIYILDSI
jgi:hypothetical protein